MSLTRKEVLAARMHAKRHMEALKADAKRFSEVTGVHMLDKAERTRWVDAAVFNVFHAAMEVRDQKEMKLDDADVLNTAMLALTRSALRSFVHDGVSANEVIDNAKRAFALEKGALLEIAGSMTAQQALREIHRPARQGDEKWLSQIDGKVGDAIPRMVAEENAKARPEDKFSDRDAERLALHARTGLTQALLNGRTRFKRVPESERTIKVQEMAEIAVRSIIIDDINLFHSVRSVDETGRWIEGCMHNLLDSAYPAPGVHSSKLDEEGKKKPGRGKS